MSYSAPAISAADLIRAIGVLAPKNTSGEANGVPLDVSLVAAIAARLGIVALPASRVSESRVNDRIPPVIVSEPDPIGDGKPVKPPSAPVSDTEAIPFELTAVGRAHRPVSIQAKPLPPVDKDEAWRRPPLQTLFVPQWTPGIAALSLSTLAQDGSVDVSHLVERLARGAMVDRLPREQAPTLRRGVQVLVDRGTAMEPFTRDQDELCDAIVRTVGGGNTNIGYFQYLPNHDRSGFGDSGIYSWPPRGTVILLLSDLGRLRPRHALDGASSMEWGAFADQAARVGCPVVAYTPLAVDKQPQWLRKKITVIPWDRKTTAGLVRGLAAPRPSIG